MRTIDRNNRLNLLLVPGKQLGNRKITRSNQIINEINVLSTALTVRDLLLE